MRFDPTQRYVAIERSKGESLPKTLEILT
jgi:hypothetical protein